MMKNTPEMDFLLQEIIRKKNPMYLEIIETPEALTSEQINIICSELAEELCESGLEKNDEPNERGKIIYDLISYINQFHKK